MTSIIINDTVPYTQAIATVGQTQFDTDWTAQTSADVLVYARADGVLPNDVTQLVPTSEYVVSFVGAELFVRVTFIIGRVALDVVTITRATPVDRQNLYTNTNFTPSMLNSDFGMVTLEMQERELYNTQLTPRYNTSATINSIVDTILPILPARNSWRKNQADTAIEFFEGLDEADVSTIKFIVQQPNALVPSAQALSDLTTGMMKNNVPAGEITISAPITSLDSIGITIDKMPYGAATNVYALTDLTPYSRTLLAQPDANDWRNLLQVGPIPALTYLAIANNLSDVASVPASVANLGLTIGVFTQAFDATLQSISALGTTADKMIYTTGIDTWAETAITALGRSLVASIDAIAAAATLNVLPLTGGQMTGPLLLAGPPVVGSEAVTKAYVDNIVQNQEIAVVALADSLPGYTYNNAASGVGASLTAPAPGIFTVDDINPGVGNRVLVDLVTNPEYNGAYTVTVTNAGLPAVLTRATDYDQASEIQPGDLFTVVQGTVFGASQWVMSQVNPITIGTTPITFTQLAGQGALLAANNLSDLTDVAAARVNLGLEIGVNVQAWDATLQSISALGTAADKMIYTTGVDTWAETNITLFGRLIAGTLSVASASLVTNNAGVPTLLGPMLNGEIVVGSTGLTPVKTTLTAGDSIQIVNAPGSITIKGGGSPTDSILLMGG